jgi:hypothetical protein
MKGDANLRGTIWSRSGVAGVSPAEVVAEDLNKGMRGRTEGADIPTGVRDWRQGETWQLVASPYLWKKKEQRIYDCQCVGLPLALIFVWHRQSADERVFR